jgi:tetratricopeptide (TPR) repeat protein/tRNA A-37 threonylcarbamoyl transferase component Bud32
MRGGRSALKRVIDSVADGNSDIDWEEVEREVGSERDLELLRQLRVVARLSEMQRVEIDRIETPPLAASAKARDRLRTKSLSLSAEPDTPAVADEDDRAPLPARRWGRLELHERLGEGMFGEVYRAFDPQLQREVAVKLLHVGKAQAARRVLDEARALARVHHPNVVIVHDAESHDGRVGLCMEFIRGQTLANLLKTHGTLGATEATATGQALCRALAAVHKEGLLHRDIKAQNVMREHGGRVVLMDFGAGQRRDAAAQGRARLTGTPLYLAPEVLAGQHATIQSDIYSLGVLLYHLVTDDYPVIGNSLDELKDAHRQGRRVRLHDVRPDLSEAFVRVVERAIDAEPSRRYQSAGELGEALGGPHVVLRTGPILPSGWWLALVSAAVAVWAITVSIDPLRRWLGIGGRPVIAVLPFETGGDLPAYVASDVTDAIRQALASLDEVRIVSHTSAAAVQRAGMSLPALANTLGASVVLEGRVLRADGGLALSFQLVRGKSDHTLLARKIPFTRQNFSQLQHQIIQLVGQTLDIKVPTEVSRRFEQGRAGNADARDLYARARFELSRNSAAGKDKAVQLFQQAIALDPGFALAHSGLARAYWTTMTFQDMPEAYELAERAAHDALALDESVSEAHAILADIKAARDWDWSSAEAHYKKAVELNPSYELAQQRYAMLMAARGRTAEAVSRIAEARRIDPLSAETLLAEATVLQYAGHFQQALTQAERGERLRPDNPAVYVVRGRVLAALGRHAEARKAFVRAGELDTTLGREYIEVELAALDAVTGRRTEAMEALAHLEAKALNGEFDSAMVAMVHGRLGDLDQGFAWLERARQDRSSRLVWIKVDPRFKPFTKDPRFTTLVQRIGI